MPCPAHGSKSRPGRPRGLVMTEGRSAMTEGGVAKNPDLARPTRCMRAFHGCCAARCLTIPALFKNSGHSRTKITGTGLGAPYGVCEATVVAVSAGIGSV